MHARTDALFAFEHYKLLEWEGFAPKLNEQSASDSVPLRLHDLAIEETGEGVTLRLFWNPVIGQPRRRGRPKPIAVHRGEWARLLINGRHTSYSGQIYTEATYNVAVDQSLVGDVFLSRAADRILDLREDLF